MADVSYATIDNLTDAHGVLMAVAFGLLMPLGSALLRLIKSRIALKIHIAFLTTAYIFMLAGFGLGVFIAWHNGQLVEPHAIIGIIVVGTLFLQPLGGMIAHWRFVKVGRNFFGLVHRWIGRIFVTLAAINAGLGLQLADASWRWKVAYSVVAGVLVLFWWAVSLVDWQKYRRHEGKRAPTEKRSSMSEPALSA